MLVMSGAVNVPRIFAIQVLTKNMDVFLSVWSTARPIDPNIPTLDVFRKETIDNLRHSYSSRLGGNLLNAVIDRISFHGFDASAVDHSGDLLFGHFTSPPDSTEVTGQ